MSTRKRLQAALGLALLLVLAPAADADVLFAIPDTALAAVFINRLEETSDKIDLLAERLHAPVLSALSQGKVYTGIHAGLDTRRTLAAALFPAKDLAAPPEWVIFVPVTDYDKFLAQLGPEDADKPVARVRVLGHALRVCRQVCRDGQFAALASEDSRIELKDLLRESDTIGTGLGHLNIMLQSMDIFAVVTPAGLAFGSDYLERSLAPGSQAKKNASAGKPDGAPPADRPVPAADTFVAELLRQGLPKFQSEVTHLALGVGGIDGEQGMRLTAWAVLASEKPWREAYRDWKEPTACDIRWQQRFVPDLLAAGKVPAILRHEIVAGLTETIAIRDRAGLSPNERAQLSAAIGKLILPIDGGAIEIGPAGAGSGLIGLVQVADAPGFLQGVEQAATSLAKILKLPVGDERPVAIKRIDVDNRAAVEVAFDRSALDLSFLEGGRRASRKRAATGETISVYLQAADEKMVVLAYRSADGLGRAKTAAGGPMVGAAPPSDPDESGPMECNNSQWICQVQPRWLLGMLQANADRLPFGGVLSILPDLPETRPIVGYGELVKSGLVWNAEVPTATLDAIGDYINRMRGNQ